MAVDEDCKNEIFSIIQSQLNNIPIFFRDIAKDQARQMIIQFVNNLRYDLDLTLMEYLEAHPEVKRDYPMVMPLIPECAYQYTMQELKDCLWEIKNQMI